MKLKKIEIFLLCALLAFVGCGMGETTKDEPANVEINGDQNQVNIDNDGPASNEQTNSNAGDVAEVENQDAVDCCLARGNALDEDDNWTDGGDCYREAKKYLKPGCECPLEDEIRVVCGEDAED